MRTKFFESRGLPSDDHDWALIVVSEDIVLAITAHGTCALTGKNAASWHRVPDAGNQWWKPLEL